jgi:hypothetical protein
MEQPPYRLAHRLLSRDNNAVMMLACGCELLVKHQEVGGIEAEDRLSPLGGVFETVFGASD